MGRHKKYPDAENTIAAFYAAVSDSYRNPTSEEIGDVNGRKKQELLAEEFGISRLKVRKNLITTGDVTYPMTRTIQEFLAAGKSKTEICRQLKIAIATLNSFLPYEKGVWFKTAIWEFLCRIMWTPTFPIRLCGSSRVTLVL